MKRILFFYLILAIIIGTPTSWYAWPKSIPHPMSPGDMQYLYRGFGFTDGTSIIGKQWFAVTWDPEDDGSHWRFEYKREGYQMFTELMERFNEEVCTKLFLVKPVSNVDIDRLERRRKIEQERMVIGRGEGEEKKKPVRREKKVGRNESCPCGSGKKYKKCCGKG